MSNNILSAVIKSKNYITNHHNRITKLLYGKRQFTFTKDGAPTIVHMITSHTRKMVQVPDILIML